jgi:hypothetical protein
MTPVFSLRANERELVAEIHSRDLRVTGAKTPAERARAKAALLSTVHALTAIKRQKYAGRG